MVFGVREIVSHLSQFMTLYPGTLFYRHSRWRR